MTTQVTWDRGVSLPAHGLWMDSQVVRDVSVVTHAHSDHTRRHRVAALTPETLALLPPSRRPHAAIDLRFGEPVAIAGGTLTAHPAGHMLGSAQVVFDDGSHRLLYTGDIKLRTASGGDIPVPQADVIVIESTYGRPHFRFPDPATGVELVARWCRRRLDQGVTPVLLAHAVGKAQELMLALAPHGFTFALERRCLESVAAYAAAGQPIPEHVPLDGDPGDRVVISPPAGKESIRRLGRYRTLLVSGWALEPSFWPKFGADEAVALSDHCDFDELITVVERSGARQAYTVHGFTDELARSLRRRGIRACALRSMEQLALPL